MKEYENDIKQREIQKHRRNAKLTLIIGLFIVVIIPVLLTRQSFWSAFNFTQTGQIGDTIGGITSPIVNLIAAILVYLKENRNYISLLFKTST
ncbi:MAG: hypothetical protein A3K10_04940 [Bacteroidetes bacterium RIFCSPLOWO2_12_FULL_31_6]|nr:MAG: hypothetical protein A3K10_04940 [Bacteroidetes bacterium RIFCSPLOWO2_12_FULL_31_6]